MAATFVKFVAAAFLVQTTSAWSIGRRQAGDVAAAPAAVVPTVISEPTNSTNTTGSVVIHRAMWGADCNSTIGMFDDKVWVLDECVTFYMWDSINNNTLAVARMATVNTTHVTFTTFRNSNGTCTPASDDTRSIYPLDTCMTSAEYVDEDEEDIFNMSEIYRVENWTFNLTGPSIEGEHLFTTADDGLERTPDTPVVCPSMSTFPVNRTTYINVVGKCSPGDTIYEVTENNITTRHTYSTNFTLTDSPQFIKKVVVGEWLISGDFWDANCTQLAYGEVWLAPIKGQCNIELEDPIGAISFDYFVPANATTNATTTDNATAPVAPAAATTAA